MKLDPKTGGAIALLLVATLLAMLLPAAIHDSWGVSVTAANILGLLVAAMFFAGGIWALLR